MTRLVFQTLGGKLLTQSNGHKIKVQCDNRTSPKKLNKKITLKILSPLSTDAPLLMYGRQAGAGTEPRLWTLSHSDRRSFVIACHIFVACSDCCSSCCCLVWCGIFVSEMWAMLLSENWVICSGLVCGRDGLAEISMTKGLRCWWWQRSESGVGKVNSEIK